MINTLTGSTNILIFCLKRAHFHIFKTVTNQKRVFDDAASDLYYGDIVRCAVASLRHHPQESSRSQMSTQLSSLIDITDVKSVLRWKRLQHRNIINYPPALHGA